MHGWQSCAEERMAKPVVPVCGVLCDTSYLIRWAKPDAPLHGSAQEYLRFLVENGHELYVSTIALAEYAVGDAISNLPLRYFRVLPFNIDHAERAGQFARRVFEARKTLPAEFKQRAVIPNDTKLFAQADVTPGYHPLPHSRRGMREDLQPVEVRGPAELSVRSSFDPVASGVWPPRFAVMTPPASSSRLRGFA